MAGLEYFLRLDGIDGDSTVKGYEKWLDVKSYHFETPKKQSGGWVEAALFRSEHLWFTVNYGAHSQRLFLFAATKSPISSGTMHVRRRGSKPALVAKFQLTGVQVLHYQTGGSDGAVVLPIDQIALQYMVIKHELNPKK